MLYKEVKAVKKQCTQLLYIQQVTHDFLEVVSILQQEHILQKHHQLLVVQRYEDIKISQENNKYNLKFEGMSIKLTA